MGHPISKDRTSSKAEFTAIRSSGNPNENFHPLVQNHRVSRSGQPAPARGLGANPGHLREEARRDSQHSHGISNVASSADHRGADGALVPDDGQMYVPRPALSSTTGKKLTKAQLSKTLDDALSDADTRSSSIISLVPPAQPPPGRDTPNGHEVGEHHTGASLAETTVSLPDSVKDIGPTEFRLPCSGQIDGSNSDLPSDMTDLTQFSCTTDGRTTSNCNSGHLLMMNHSPSFANSELA